VAEIQWHQEAHPFEAGVSQGVLYLDNGKGVAWNGIISVDDEPSGGESEEYFFDGEKYLDVVSGEETSLTINAFTYPEEFSDYDGYQDILDKQTRRLFGFSYTTNKGDGRKIHIVYNCTAVPAEKSWETEGEETTPTLFGWNVATVPIQVPGAKPTAHLVVDTTEATDSLVVQLEAWLYGTELLEPRLPTAAEIVDLFLRNASFTVISHGDGSWTAMGTDDVIKMTDDTSFEISWPLAVYTDATSYTLRSS